MKITTSLISRKFKLANAVSPVDGIDNGSIFTVESVVDKDCVLASFPGSDSLYTLCERHFGEEVE